MNNLWNYLQGLSLTAANRRWLIKKFSAMDSKNTLSGIFASPETAAAKPIYQHSTAGNPLSDYKLSPHRRSLMNRVKIDPTDFDGDPRAQYILSK